MQNHINMNPRIPFAPAHLPQLYGSVKVGERGQVVIPQEARAEMGLRAGDKLLALGGIPGLQGIVFIRADSFSTMLAEITGKMSALESMLRMADTEVGNADGGRREGGDVARGNAGMSTAHKAKRSRR
jgi:AbrB family looped-hinge helix DNA binding protein